MWMLRILTIVALTFLRVQANTGDGSGNNNHGSSNLGPYVYSDITFFSSDTESQDYYYSDEEDLSDASASVVGSSLLYEGGCLVSSQAMMCAGGDAYLDDPSFFDSETDFESDDDDDDDDDGHSSMLSNASLRRSRAFVTASGDNVRYNSRSTPTTSSAPSLASFSQTNLSNTHQSAKKTALMLRGGAAGGSELSKKLLVAAIVTLVFEMCLGHWIEFLKIAMQTSPPGTTYTQIVKDITSQKGLAGLWDGFAPWGVVQAVLKGGVFGVANGFAAGVLVPLAKNGKMPMQLAMTLAGGFGGGFQGYVLSPTMLLKTRVMTNPAFREPMSVFRTTWLSLLIGMEVVQGEGFLALMKGANVFALKRVLDWGSRYFFSECAESVFIRIKKRPLTTTEKSISSLLGGVCSTMFTLPLDVLVAKMQDSKNAGAQGSAIRMVLDEFEEKGWSGMRESYTRGVEARVFHVSLTTLVMKTFAPIVYDFMFPEESSKKSS